MGYVYRYMRGDEWIYVGKTKNPLSVRIEAHSREKKFLPYLNDCQISFCEFEHNSDMDVAESVLIKHYKPTLNVSGKNSVPFPFVPDTNKIQWITYKEFKKKEQMEHQATIMKRWKSKLRPYIKAYCELETAKSILLAAKEVSRFAMRYAVSGVVSHINISCPLYQHKEVLQSFSYWGVSVSIKDDHFVIKVPSREKCESIIQRCGAVIEMYPTLIGVKKYSLEERYINGVSGERAIRLADYIDHKTHVLNIQNDGE